MLIDNTPFSWFLRRQNAAAYGDSSNHSIAAQRLFPGKPLLRRAGLAFTVTMQRCRDVLMILALTLGVGCAAPADEAALRTQIAAMSEAIEARDSDALLAPVDAEFIGPNGMDQRELQRYATLMLLRQQRVGVVIGPVEIEMYADRASAHFDAVVSGSNRFIPEGIEARRVETVWRRDGDEWRLVSADWSKRALGD